jgi:curved DNA-binding protein CbpA
MTRSEAYSILGVPSSATADELKKAYRKKAMVHHPDKGGNAEEFKKVNNAYHLISTGKTSHNYSSSTGTSESDMTPEMEEILKMVAIALAFYLVKKHFGKTRRPRYSSTRRERRKEVVKKSWLGQLKDWLVS